MEQLGNFIKVTHLAQHGIAGLMIITLLIIIYALFFWIYKLSKIINTLDKSVEQTNQKINENEKIQELKHQQVEKTLDNHETRIIKLEDKI